MKFVEDNAMKKDLCELVFILDRSGSMSGLESDTIGGFNGMLEKQKQEVGEAVITTVLFDDKYELLHDRINIEGVKPITKAEYYVRGSTALLDAVSKTLAKIENAQAHTDEAQRPEKTMVVITTDGLENASHEFRKDKVKAAIERLQEAGWEFIFLGANIDAVSTAREIGIDAKRAVDYHADSIGTKTSFQGVVTAVSQMRTCGNINDAWRKEIDKDYEERKNDI